MCKVVFYFAKSNTNLHIKNWMLHVYPLYLVTALKRIKVILTLKSCGGRYRDVLQVKKSICRGNFRNIFLFVLYNMYTIKYTSILSIISLNYIYWHNQDYVQTSNKKHSYIAATDVCKRQKSTSHYVRNN